MTDLAIFLPALHAGGAQRVAVNLANGFSRRGYNVDVVLLREDGEFNEFLEDSVRTNSLDVRPTVPILDEARALSSYLQQRDPDTLLALMSHSNIFALVADQLTRQETNILVSNHCPSKFLYRQKFQTKITLQLVRALYRFSDGIITVSKGAAQDLHQVAGIDREKIDIVYNPVVGPHIFEQLGGPVPHPFFEDDAEVILSMGGMESHRTSQKNFELLIDSFAKLVNETPANLIILGKGSGRERLLNLIQSHGIENRVQLPGYVENPFSYMEHASTFVLPSRYEGFGNVIVEAMACGCNIVSTDCRSGPSEILAKGRFGRLVDVGDVDGMASAILETIENPIPENTVRDRAMDFDIESAVDQYEMILFK